MKSVSERLADKFGGTWWYDRTLLVWICSDGRTACRVMRHDARGDLVQRYWLYEPGGLDYEITL